MGQTDDQHNQRPDAWQQWYSVTEHTPDADMPHLAELFKAQAVSRILDLGCGVGRNMIYFAERGFEMYGLDFSPYAIERAKQRLEEAKLRADLQIGGMAEQLPYPDGFFDAVLSVRALHHADVATIQNIVGEVHRVTRHGGYVYVQVPMIEKVLKYVEQGGEFSEIEPGTYVPLDGPEKGVPHHNFTEQEIRQVFRNFRIESLKTRDEHYNLLAVRWS
jgi:SAM-dependent methyltransferase